MPLMHRRNDNSVSNCFLLYGPQSRRPHSALHPVSRMPSTNSRMKVSESPKLTWTLHMPPTDHFRVQNWSKFKVTRSAYHYTSMYAVEARMKLHRKYTFYTNLVHIKRNVQKHSRRWRTPEHARILQTWQMHRVADAQPYTQTPDTRSMLMLCDDNKL